jgi:prepilin-type N-terminal cleavage/methylation domain-containing protein
MNNLRSQAGFTAIELLITVIVIGVTFGAFTTTFTTIQNINKVAIDVNLGNTAAFAKVQDYENEPFASLPNTTPQGTLQQIEDFSSSLPATLPSPRVGQVYINSMSPTLKQLVVKVQYGSGAGQRQLQYADFLQKNGL